MAVHGMGVRKFGRCHASCHRNAQRPVLFTFCQSHSHPVRESSCRARRRRGCAGLWVWHGGYCVACFGALWFGLSHRGSKQHLWCDRHISSWSMCALRHRNNFCRSHCPWRLCSSRHSGTHHVGLGRVSIQPSTHCCQLARARGNQGALHGR